MKMVVDRKQLVRLEEQMQQPCATEVSVLTLDDGSKCLSIRRIAGKKRHNGIIFHANDVQTLKECLSQLDLTDWNAKPSEE